LADGWLLIAVDMERDEGELFVDEADEDGAEEEADDEPTLLEEAMLNCCACC
jgi:hypothetical protein